MDPPQPPKNPREYTWSVDTLAYPGSFQTTMIDIWGSSENDVYTVGHNSSGFGKMWHFDGTTWSDVRLSTAQGGTIPGAIDLWAVYGFAADDIWVVGERFYNNPSPPPNFLDSSLVIHFDGTTWTEHKVPDGRFLFTVFGFSSKDLWVGGQEGTMFHYDGSAWTKIPMPGPVWTKSIGGVSSADLFALSYTFDSFSVITDYLLYWNGSAWAIVDSFTLAFGVQPKFGNGRLRVFDGELFSIGQGGIFEKSGTSWQPYIAGPFTGLAGVAGSTKSNLLAIGGSLYHYNGSNWYEFAQFSNTGLQYNALWRNEREAFVLGRTSGGYQTVMFHGK